MNAWESLCVLRWPHLVLIVVCIRSSLEMVTLSCFLICFQCHQILPNVFQHEHGQRNKTTTGLKQVFLWGRFICVKSAIGWNEMLVCARELRIFHEVITKTVGIVYLFAFHGLCEFQEYERRRQNFKF